MVINQYLQEQPLKYQRLNDAIGALECCKQELYREVVAWYEEQKKWENGDVYENVFPKEQVPTKEVQPDLFSDPVQPVQARS